MILIQRDLVPPTPWPATRRALQLGALILGLLWNPPVATADLLVTIETTSTCPSRSELNDEISQWSLPSATGSEARWRATLDHPRTGTARLRLYAQDGALALERSIRSDDCAALAKAFAIILETHFLDLGLVLPRKVDLAADETPAPELETAPKSDPKPLPEQPTQAPPQHAAASNSQLRTALGIGAQWALPEPGLTAAVRGLVGISWRNEWTLQLGLSAALPQSQDGIGSNDRVDSQAVTATLGLARRVRVDPTVWLEPHFGVGSRISRLEATQIAGENEFSARVLGELGLATGLQLGPNWSPRLDVVGELLLDRDRYIIEPHGAVGQGPRVVFFATLGVEFTGL